MPAGLAVLGCGQSDEIRHYQAVKLKQPEIKATDGMLAAIVLPTENTPGTAAAEGQAWFFKVAGPIEAVAPLADVFHKFLLSVHFVDGRPAYDVPADWHARGASEMRYETFEIPVAGGKPLELSVTTLPRGEQDEAEFVLANINRWRGQMSLRHLAGAEELAEQSQRLPLEGATATLVSLTGKLKAGGMGAPLAPFSGGINPHGVDPPTGAGGGTSRGGSSTGDDRGN